MLKNAAILKNLEAFDALLRLEPYANYAERAAAALVLIVGVSEVRITLAEEGEEEEDAEVALGLEGFTNYPMYYQNLYLGVVHFRGRPARRSEKSEAWLRWLVRVLARNLVYLRQLSRQSLSAEEIESLVDKQPLSRREKDVVAGLVCGMTTEEIARDMAIQIGSVNTYIKRARAKLGVHSRVALIALVTGQKQSVSG